MVEKRRGKARLKIYIPFHKWEEWKTHLEENQPYSVFHINFSQWLRSCFQKVPNSQTIPQYPIRPNTTSNLCAFNTKKIEKTIWIPIEMKHALKIKKGGLSLNAFILLIIDLHIYGGTTENQRIFQILNLQERIDELDLKLHQLSDKTYIQSQVIDNNF
ncbi:hypothetical protein NEF87_002821 [Candidatus Lokiarchaeum ossiferum]|uniref:Uncharacterized protein n=1 Tax=Candidatus Lokiarchaeum ossiferum TaxID=2951803 RepID=A0ABY6HSZ9_9ARCH|nr:hypothetical protein NEF87_002821 [Candidatus Lokiarchaeum sp. B-35]